jgi:O-antigen/teichoic acid export membrane protein
LPIGEIILRGIVTLPTTSRARRIFGGWSANAVQLVLALTQQIVLIPLFLKYWSGETLSAWLTIFAAGNLVLAADPGLHGWSLNRFLSFKSKADCDRRTDRYYGAAAQLFLGFAGLFFAALLLLYALIKPSDVLGFAAEPRFDLAFAIMTLGTVLTLPSNLASALYRARGCYARSASVQSWGMAAGQIGQVVAVITTGSLLVVVVAYVAGQIAAAMFILFADVRKQFPFLGRERGRISWRWTGAQLLGAFPFSVVNFAEFGLSYLSVLLIGVFVPDRIAIAQWGLTRTIVNLLRGVSIQMTLPIAAELGHDHAVGARDSLRRLYARGSVILVLFVSAATSGALAFWPDFFAIWTHGLIPYDATLTITLLLGTCVASPAILALGYANYSNRGPLLLRVKSAQLVIFLLLSVVLIPPLGPLGAAIALVSSDLIAQAGFLSVVIVSETLQHPVRYGLSLLAMMATIVPAGAALGEAIRLWLPGGGVAHFVIACALWLVVVAMVASPLMRREFRERLIARIPS